MKIYYDVEGIATGLWCEHDYRDLGAHEAELCADDFHWQHNGYECTWPLTFALRAEDGGPIVARFEVDRETVAEFNACEVSE